MSLPHGRSIPGPDHPCDGCQNGQTCPFFNPTTLLYLLIGSSLIYAGGCFINDACDHAFDQKHRPERPIPRGALSLGQAWVLGLAQLGVGAWAMIVGAGCHWQWTLALLLCILAYDWAHKKSAWSILLMGGCRSLLWITAATAASGMSPAPPPLCMGQYGRALCGGHILVCPQ